MTYTYIVHTPGFGDDCYPTRHDAVGEKAILDAIGVDCEIRVRDRYATDPVNLD